MVHEGQFLEPMMRDLEAFFRSTQEQVSGKVTLHLAPYRFYVMGIESAHDLMSNKFGSYGEMNNTWSGDDVKGFSKIFGNQTSIYFKVNDINE
jgi:argininosuccinate synthase